MTVQEYMDTAVRRLMDAGITTARLDVLVLLEDTVNQDRARLLAHPETLLTSEQTNILDEQLERRCRHTPLAYIRGKTEFYGREFMINKYVLEPRPESEMMIDLLKYLPGSNHMIIADIGTGSGALAITAKLDLPDSEVIAVDIDDNCLSIAMRNARKQKADVTFLHGNLLEPLKSTGTKPDALLCNLPYVPNDFNINIAATHEPKLAIFGGKDGLDMYRQMFMQIDQFDLRPRYILTESLPPQHAELTAIATMHSYTVHTGEDFIQVFKSVSV